MKWLCLKRKIRSHPALLDPYRTLSGRQARAQWKKLGRPTVAELMEGSRVKANKSEKEWSELTGYSDKRRRAKGARSFGLPRRWAVACIAALLIVLFMAFTAPGRALAQSIYNTVSTIIGDMLYIQSKETDLDAVYTEPQSNSAGTDKQLSLRQAYEQLKRPLLYLKEDEYTLKNVSVSESEFMGASVESEYQADDITIVITQRWPLAGQPAMSSIDVQNGEYHSVRSSIGFTIEGVYRSADYTYVGSATTDTMVFAISIQDVPQIHTVDKIAAGVAYYKE